MKNDEEDEERWRIKYIEIVCSSSQFSVGAPCSRLFPTESEASLLTMRVLVNLL